MPDHAGLFQWSQELLYLGDEPVEKHPNDTYPCPKQEENDNLLPLSSGLVRVYMTSESDSMHSEERVLRQVLSTGTALYHVLSTMKPPERTLSRC